MTDKKTGASAPKNEHAKALGELGGQTMAGQSTKHEQSRFLSAETSSKRRNEMTKPAIIEAIEDALELLATLGYKKGCDIVDNLQAAHDELKSRLMSGVS